MYIITAIIKEIYFIHICRTFYFPKIIVNKIYVV